MGPSVLRAVARALDRPNPQLIHVPTIDLEADGQAFSWAQDGSRMVFTVDRRKGQVRMIELPAVHPVEPGVSLRFR